MEISTCIIITAACSKHATEKEAIFKLFRGVKRQQLAGKHLLQRGAAGPAMLKCFCMYSLIRIRYFISVAAWLIPAIIHFLCGLQLQVLKCVSISIRCLLLLDINTCFWLSLEMFYFGFNTGSSQELQEDTQLFSFSGTKGRGGGGWWVIPGLLMAPHKLQAHLQPGWCPPQCQGLFPDAVAESMGATAGWQKPTVPTGGSVGWGSTRAPHHLSGCWVLAPGRSICLFLFTCVSPPGIASHD